MKIYSAKKSIPPLYRIFRVLFSEIYDPRFGDQNGARTAHSPAIAPPAFRAIRQKIVCKSVPNTYVRENTNKSGLLFMALCAVYERKIQFTMYFIAT